MQVEPVDDEVKETLRFGSGGHVQRPHIFYPLAFSNEQEYLYSLAKEINEDYTVRVRVHEGMNMLVAPVSDIQDAIGAIQGLFLFLFGPGYFFDDSEREMG